MHSSNFNNCFILVRAERTWSLLGINPGCDASLSHGTYIVSYVKHKFNSNSDPPFHALLFRSCLRPYRWCSERCNIICDKYDLTLRGTEIVTLDTDVKMQCAITLEQFLLRWALYCSLIALSLLRVLAFLKYNYHINTVSVSPCLRCKCHEVRWLISILLNYDTNQVKEKFYSKEVKTMLTMDL